MKKFFLLFALLLSPMMAMASVGGCGEVHCEHAPVDLHNKESLQNGAKVFISYCLGCHSAKYLRYERMAQDLEIDPKLVAEYMMFTTDKIGDPMDTKVDKKASSQMVW
jgi:ubiquinol-cytochrome c reductase cytochrome c1 subunit